jgi:hypothetical protein
MCYITYFVKQKQVICERHLLAVLKNTLAAILLAEPSNCLHPVPNKIGPIHLFLSLSAYTALFNPSHPLPPITVHKLDTQEPNKAQKY